MSVLAILFDVVKRWLLQLLFRQGFTSTAGGVTQGMSVVDAKPVAPSGQLVESALLVPFVDITEPLQSSGFEVPVVNTLVIEADAKAVVFQVLLVPVDIYVVDDGGVESLFHILRNRCESGVCGVFGKFVSVVLEVEERVEISKIGVIE